MPGVRGVCSPPCFKHRVPSWHGHAARHPTPQARLPPPLPAMPLPPPLPAMPLPPTPAAATATDLCDDRRWLIQQHPPKVFIADAARRGARAGRRAAAARRRRRLAACRRGGRTTHRGCCHELFRIRLVHAHVTQHLGREGGRTGERCSVTRGHPTWTWQTQLPWGALHPRPSTARRRWISRMQALRCTAGGGSRASPSRQRQPVQCNTRVLNPARPPSHAHLHYVALRNLPRLVVVEKIECSTHVAIRQVLLLQAGCGRAWRGVGMV